MLWFFIFCSIDASEIDSFAKSVNDTVHGNCKMKKLKVDGKDHLCLFATKRINTGDELRYNYTNDRKDCNELFGER